MIKTTKVSKQVRYTGFRSDLLIQNYIYYVSYILEVGVEGRIYYGIDIDDKRNKFNSKKGGIFNEHYYQFAAYDFEDISYPDDELVINIIKIRGVI